eukprot:scaffold161007_cov32-Prasinocladus_malaysianus.AAC.1
MSVAASIAFERLLSRQKRSASVGILCQSQELLILGPVRKTVKGHAQDVALSTQRSGRKVADE